MKVKETNVTHIPGTLLNSTGFAGHENRKEKIFPMGCKTIR